MQQPKFWAKFKTLARKLAPARWVRWAVIYVPFFTATILLALRVAGGMDDLIAYVLESGARSVPVLIGLSIAYGLSCVLGWNLDNADRAKYQRLLVAGGQNARGAFLVLAGEVVSVLALAYIILRALLAWQG
jgi:hypothetical protein